MAQSRLFTLTRWYRNDGEFVHKGDALCEIETDKASTEITADKDGILHHLATVGDVVRIGNEVARIDPVP